MVAQGWNINEELRPRRFVSVPVHFVWVVEHRGYGGWGLPSTLLGPEGTARMGGVALNGPSRLLGEPPTVVLVGRGSGWDRP